MGIIGYALTLAMLMGQQQWAETGQQSDTGIVKVCTGGCTTAFGYPEREWQDAGQQSGREFKGLRGDYTEIEKQPPSSGNVTNILKPLIGQPCTMEGAITIQQLNDGTLLQCVPRWELPEPEKQPAGRFVPAVEHKEVSGYSNCKSAGDGWLAACDPVYQSWWDCGENNHTNALLTSADGQQHWCMEVK